MGKKIYFLKYFSIRTKKLHTRHKDKENIKFFWKVFYIGFKYTTDLSIIHRGPPSIISGRISGVMCNVPEVSTK